MIKASLGWRDRLRTVPKTVGALALLNAALPANLALTAVALLRTQSAPPANESRSAQPKTIMLSGGKMTKALQLARSFHAAGHRVILVESGRYRLTGHRFSRAVDRFWTVPDASDPGYVDALVAIVQRERVDVYVPVCSPASSHYDAVAKPVLSRYCEVLHGDPAVVDEVDDKFAFATAAAALGLAVPDTHLITDPEQVEAFDFHAHPGDYILKSIPYDPVHRLDLTRLPRATSEQTVMFARTRPIAEDNPWILQAFVPGQEYCTHGTARDGRLQVWCCCASSASQLNYAMIDKPEIEAWVTRFVAERNLTGQYSFDFIEASDGSVQAIECNPRTHSAITMLYDHPGVAAAYLETGGPTVRPTPESRPTYWAYHEIWQLLRHPSTARARIGVIRSGKDAIFDWTDPLPFLMAHHAQIPSLLIMNLVRLRPWVKIDFNIGKLVEPGGD